MRKRIDCNFKSVFAREFHNFLDYRIQGGIDGREDRYILRSLDNFLLEYDLTQKVLDPVTIEAWISSLSVDSNTRPHHIGVYRQLAYYLNGIGFEAYVPPPLHTKRNYTPYVLTHDEVQRVFGACDNIAGDKSLTNASLWLPVMVRMLYGCGLRIGEAVSLQNKDIDWDLNTLLIRAAKGNKDRLVPMSDSLSEICASYYAVSHPKPKSEDYFFHNHKGQPLSTLTPYIWIRRAYEVAGIDRYPDPTQTRGKCVHTFRHTFAVHSLQKQTKADIDRFYAIPILSTYMGHNDIYGTELYLQLTPEYHESVVERVENYVGNIFPEVSE